MGVYGYTLARKYSDRPAEVHWETKPVDRGRIVSTVTASGALSALLTVQVGTQVSGRVAELHADFNVQVKKGQVLAKIDPQLFLADQAKARANVAAANGQLSKSKANAENADKALARARNLAAEGLIGQSDLDLAESAVKVAKADIDAQRGALAQAEASLRQSDINLGFTTIVSPIDGIVISRNVDVGQTVAASLQAPTLFTIAQDLRKMHVDTNVAEADVGKLKAAMEVTFTVDAYPGEQFKGTVEEVRNSPTTIQNVVTYDALINVDNAALKLKPGMTATVTFITGDRPDALRVPNAALRFRAAPEVSAMLPAVPPPSARPAWSGRAASSGDAPPGDRPMATPGGRQRLTDRRPVLVLRDGKPVRAIVKVGLTDGSFTEALEGVAEGDLLVTDATVTGGKPAATTAPAAGPRLF